MELSTFALVGATTVVALLAAYFSVRQGHERLALTASFVCLLALIVGAFLTIDNEIQSGNKGRAVIALLFGAVFCLIVVGMIFSALHRAVGLRFEADKDGITLHVRNIGSQYATFMVLLDIVSSSLLRSQGRTALMSGERIEYKPIALHAGQPAQVRIANIQTSWGGKAHNPRMYTLRQRFSLLVNGEEFATTFDYPPTIPSETLSCSISVFRDPPTLHRNESRMRCWIEEDGRLLFQADDADPLELDRYRRLNPK